MEEINLEKFSINTKAFTIKSLRKESEGLHWWCIITPLSGELEEGIYMATFADDSRILFEVPEYEEVLRILPTTCLREWWNDNESPEDEENLLKEILYGFLRYKEEL